MRWKLAEAKQRLSEVVRMAAEEPQVILNRDRPVAAVIPAEGLEDYLQWRAGRGGDSLVDALAEAAEICREEGVSYEAPPRIDRASPFDSKSGKRRAGRHQRHQ
jgi:prevent-host-death family protein